jgi:DNA-3-methyladenine glycosylase
MKKLTVEFYDREDVLQIAADLLGKIIITKFDGQLTAARIVETEAYIGLTDKASHSFAGKRTARNEHMYAAPATAYVYICYGMHHLFNVVTNKKNIPDAVLIRAAEPVAGIEIMLQRSSKKIPDYTLTKGPGNLAKALGITKAQSGFNLTGNKMYIAADGWSSAGETGTSARIGIEGAGPVAAALPYRFYIKGNKYVSGYPNK